MPLPIGAWFGAEGIYCMPAGVSEFALAKALSSRVSSNGKLGFRIFPWYFRNLPGPDGNQK